MSIEDYKPTPDELLQAVKEEEFQKKGGKLKLFFGMCAGVGKTYTMLEEAHQRQKEGLDVQIGVVNTHGRKETEELVKGLPIIPLKWIPYRDALFEEMDLEAILQKRPDLVLVDELAHTNVPGTKHAKRWQDVMEILDNGIDVYTTLNVQHLESRKDVVESITGIPVRETVPDVILERADNIELIDLSPQELLQRLREGKVYLADQSRRAVENFFKEETLTALRKIALKFTAEKVDHDLHGILSQRGKWTIGERLLVAVSSSPYSEQLIRATRKRAFELDAPWIAVYVDRGWALNDEDQKRLSRNLSLARDLGAEIITIFDTDVARGIMRVARQKNATRIVIGRPTKKGFQDFFQRNLVDILTEEAKEFDLIVLRQEKLTSIFQRVYRPAFPTMEKLREYGIAVLLYLIISVLSWFISPFLGFKLIAFIYMLGTLGLSFFLTAGPIILYGLLSVFTWNFFFYPPLFKFTYDKFEDTMFMGVFFISAILIGILTSRFREQGTFLRQREERIEHLFDIEKDIANSTDFETMRRSVIAQLENIFPGKFDIISVDLSNKLRLDSAVLPVLKNEKEQAAARWVFEQGKLAGRFTDTLPSAQAIYFPIQSLKSRLGVLLYQPNTDRPLSPGDINFLQTTCQLIEAFLERYQLTEKTRIQSFAAQLEKLHSAILHSVSKGFYAPLLKLFDLISTLRKMPDQNPILIVELDEIANTLKFIVDNILLLSEIESGFIKTEKLQQSIVPLVDGSIADSAPFIQSRIISTNLPEQRLYFHYDMKLMRLALRNVILNAIENSPQETPIKIDVTVHENEVYICVSDEGPGIPDDLLQQIFEKFYRLPGSASPGLGLELAVVKAVMEIHNGRIEIKRTLDKSTIVCLIIPL